VSATPAELLGARRIVVPANGLDFEVFEAGAGDRLALLLHGFPQHAIVWRGLVPGLVAKGYRVWAVNQRGYGETTRPLSVDDYRLDKLTDDVAALIDASGARSVALVAHDWGGFVSWTFAIRRLRQIERLAVFNIPHPLCYRRAREGWGQKLRTSYVKLFDLPKIVDWVLSVGGGFLVGLSLRLDTRAGAIGGDAIALYRANVSAPGASTAMLNWYRAAGHDLDAAADLDVPIETPTLVIWGDGDKVFGPSCLEGTELYVKDLRIQRLPGVSHWGPEDAAEKAAELLADFL